MDNLEIRATAWAILLVLVAIASLALGIAGLFQKPQQAPETSSDAPLEPWE